jgi:hypothetical protein
MAGLALVSRLVVTPLGTRLVVTTPIDAWTASQAPRAPPDRRRRDAERRTEIAEWGDRLPDPRVLGRHVLDLDPEVLRRHRSP